jgi:hypothetical protein
MRVVAATLIALMASLSLAVAQQQAPEAQQVAPTGPGTTGPGTPARSPQDAAPHPGNAAANPEQQRQGEQTVQSKSGQGGKEEPSTKPAAANQEAPFLDGKLNVPGAPADSQTVPAKFSERNAAIDKKPILGFLELTPEQRRAVFDAVKATDTPVVSSNAKVTEELSSSVALHELPLSLTTAVPELRDLKYMRLNDRILLVYPPSWIVVGEVKG